MSFYTGVNPTATYPGLPITQSDAITPYECLQVMYTDTANNPKSEIYHKNNETLRPGKTITYCYQTLMLTTREHY